SCDASIITGTTSTVFPISTLGTTVVTWTFTDASGNTTTANQNVVVADTSAPVTPTLSDVTFECIGTPIAPTTTDSCDASTITGTTSTVFPISTLGTTVVTWTFTDASGNTTTANQNVVVADTIAPIIASFPEDVIIECNDPIPSADILSIVATDNCTNTNAINITVEETDNGGDSTATNPLIITRIYTVTDSSGNSATHTQILTVNNCGVDIGLTKTASVDEAAVNDYITFTITATNYGPQDATNIKIEEVLPEGYTYDSHTLSSYTTSGGTSYDGMEIWSISKLDVNETATLELRVRVTNTIEYLNVVTLLSVDQLDIDDSNDTASDQIEVSLSTDCVVVYNIFSPNNDGVNDTLIIDCLENYPGSTLEIFNRWGNEVYSATDYKSDWDGTSTGRATISPDEKLPRGTYFYILDLKDGSTVKKGWIQLVH
uniref:T9SS type B sorting domain-containing protein n=1 Tax=uncultured Polaribacter sp. TaxID=174711 RepID=UPI00260B0311